MKPAPEAWPSLSSRVRGLAVGFCLGDALSSSPDDGDGGVRRQPTRLAYMASKRQGIHYFCAGSEDRALFGHAGPATTSETHVTARTHYSRLSPSPTKPKLTYKAQRWRACSYQ